jgi:5-methylcytosine-specific restriction endonuclease McrA
LSPLVAPLPPLVGVAPGDRKAFDRQRDGAAPWRAWYRSQRWFDLRLEILVRDCWICQRTGLICAGRYPAPDSAVVDHIERHNGDPVLFWSPSNLQTLSKVFHDSTKQAEERRADFA